MATLIAVLVALVVPGLGQDSTHRSIGGLDLHLLEQIFGEMEREDSPANTPLQRPRFVPVVAEPAAMQLHRLQLLSFLISGDAGLEWRKVLFEIMEDGELVPGWSIEKQWIGGRAATIYHKEQWEYTFCYANYSLRWVLRFKWEYRPGVAACVGIIYPRREQLPGMVVIEEYAVAEATAACDFLRSHITKK